MRHSARGHETQLASCGDGSVFAARRAARAELVAAHVRAVDVCYARVGLVVLGLAHGRPVCGFGLVVDY